VNHQKWFIDPDTDANTQTIEAIQDQAIAPLRLPKKKIWWRGLDGAVGLVVHSVVDTGTFGGQVKMRFASQ